MAHKVEYAAVLRNYDSPDTELFRGRSIDAVVKSINYLAKTSSMVTDPVIVKYERGCVWKRVETITLEKQYNLEEE